MPRRELWAVLGSVLEALEAERASPEPRLSNVATRANVAYARLREHLSILAARGLVDYEDIPRLTPRGQAFLREYRAWSGVLQTLAVLAAPRRPRGP
ncbi:MAG TPA: hypothetical protein VFH78_05695 [Candidatus Thermoplasmatota archaeon]|nr:hypothetical protein [Candidatus Thermoplasmatota archaeon]